MPTMTRANQMAYLIVVLVAVAAGPAIAQQKRSLLHNFELNMLNVRGGNIFPQRGDSLLSLAAIEAVQMDLAVTDDVARKLTRLPLDYQAEIDKELIILRGKSGMPEQREKIREMGLKLDAEF